MSKKKLIMDINANSLSMTGYLRPTLFVVNRLSRTIS
ncbi:hypothetical protein ACI8B_400006 [Acinetobacter proteolyticus]|uniref:Uncharacterized protein n=1 Tax=Acinetobacter proteolyticus TaxID=1776741 RepID=A0A653K920_9GAMM|nr:hypothetical protein ACI8B_400006 [Acinetobacter proteolyticus]